MTAIIGWDTVKESITNTEWWRSNDPYVRLEGIANLKDCWCGPDSIAFTEEHIARCKVIVNSFMSKNLPPFISPAQDCIDLYWKCEEMQRELEINVWRNKENPIVYFIRTEPDYEIEGVITDNNLNNLIQYLTP